MTAFFGAAQINYGVTAGEDIFVVISDGITTKFMIPMDTSIDEAKDLLRAMGSRLTAFASTDPEEIIESMVYNFPAEILLSEPLETFEDAVVLAQQYMTLVNGFDEEPSPLLDAITETEEYIDLNKTYAAIYQLPGDYLVALIDFEPYNGKDTLNRVEGKWVPLEEDEFDALSGHPIDTVSAEIVNIFDKAERDNIAITRNDVAEFIIPRS